MQLSKGTFLGRRSLKSRCRIHDHGARQVPLTPHYFPTGYPMQGTGYIYNSYVFHYSFAVVTSNVINRTANIRYFKLKIYNFQQHLDDTPLDETC